MLVNLYTNVNTENDTYTKQLTLIILRTICFVSFSTSIVHTLLWRLRRRGASPKVRPGVASDEDLLCSRCPKAKPLASSSCAEGQAPGANCMAWLYYPQIQEASGA